MHVAVIGCGQLARMLALAGWPLGLRFSFLAEAGEATECVTGLGAVVGRAIGDEAGRLYEALGRPDVITVEKEQVDVDLMRNLAAYCPVRPGPQAVWYTQNRRREKELLSALEIPTASWRPARDAADVRAAAEALGLPLIVKSATEGYDGKNQWHIDTDAALQAFTDSCGQGDWVVESKVPFEREVAFLGARSSSGEVVFYPATETRQVSGVLRSALAPAEALDEQLIQQGQQRLRRLLEHLDYAGVLAMECFVVDGQLLVNELAPRVHNSGHWTQQGALTSQFENHLRAILGLPLGATALRGAVGCLNLLGQTPALGASLGARVTVHLYGKTPRPGRKLGHINLVCDSSGELQRELERLEELVYGASSERKAG